MLPSASTGISRGSVGRRGALPAVGTSARQGGSSLSLASTLILGLVLFLLGCAVGRSGGWNGGSSTGVHTSTVDTAAAGVDEYPTRPTGSGVGRKGAKGSKRGSATLSQKGGMHSKDRKAHVAKNMTFEEIINLSGALDGYPPLPADGIGASGHPFYTVQPMQLLSWHPRTYLFPKFIHKSMCDHVIGLAEPRLHASSLALKPGDTLESTREIRTSQGTFLSRSMDEAGILAYIEDKIAVMTGIPSGHGEPFNVLRYKNGQHYDSHYDAFDEESYGKQASQRIATVLVYLSDVEEGGETSFLFEGVGGTERIHGVDYKKCDTGIKYKPRAGDALLFWSIHPDLSRDKHSLHGGCPVVKGTKWTATKWIRDKCSYFEGGPPCSSLEVN
jgi:prolyl 4-hydroxylase